MAIFQSVKYQLNIKIVSDNEEIKKHYEQFSSHHNGDSGVDLFSLPVESIKEFSVGTINFGIQCEMIDLSDNTLTSYYLYPRSSLYKTSFQLANSVGIIDAGYRGNLMAKVRHFPDMSDINNKIANHYYCTQNFNYQDIYIPKLSIVGTLNKGCWFQIVSPDMKPIRVNIVNELTTTTRGEDGFGSTTKI